MILPLVLAAALAQTSPAPAGSASPSPAPSTDATATAPSMFFHRMPLGTIQSSPGDAVIRNSGSTNVGGFTIVVHPDASADVYVNGAKQQKTVGEAQAKWLFAKLKADEPLSSIAAGHCMKSASFGTTTNIAYDGQSTSDLSCGGGDAARELSRTIGVIVNQLGVAPGPGRIRRLL